MNALTMIDEWILNRYQSAAHKVQKLTGKTNFWMAGMCWLGCALVLVLAILLFVFHSRPALALRFAIYPAGRYTLWLDFLCAIILFRSALFHCRRQEAAAFTRLARGLGNPRRISTLHRFQRLAFVMLLVPSIAMGFILFAEFQIFQALFISGLYLEAADPLPPCPGTIREWLGAFRARPAEGAASA